MNIYITKDNEDKLRQLKGYTMSGLVNYLLIEYWKTHTVEQIKIKLEPKLEIAAKQNPEVVKPIDDLQYVPFAGSS